MPTKPKRQDKALEMRTFSGKDGRSYLVFRTAKNAFHAFVEVEAKQAARECGGKTAGNTRSMWQRIWDENSP